MKKFNIVMLTNMIAEVIYIACVTFAACHFERPALLAWYILALFMGYSYKEKTNGNDK